MAHFLINSGRRVKQSLHTSPMGPEIGSEGTVKVLSRVSGRGYSYTVHVAHCGLRGAPANWSLRDLEFHHLGR